VIMGRYRIPDLCAGFPDDGECQREKQKEGAHGWMYER
jgi:hypothetical protein